MFKEYIKYFGKRFYKQKDGYWANIMPIHAHRWVWINHYGSIASGMDIHHKDGNKDNNEIENLEILSRSEHLKRHWEDPELRKERRAFLEKIRPKVHEYLRSEEGRKKQSIVSKKAWEKRRSFVINCIECQRQITTKQPWTKFCHVNCEKKHRRKKGIDKVEANCLVCYKRFLKDKYSPQKFCSISCGAKNSSRNRAKPVG